MWSTAKWRTAIAEQLGLDEGENADAEEGVASARPGRALAAVAVMGLAVALAVLPASIAFGVAPGPVGQVAAGLGGLAAVVGGVRLVAVILGMARFAVSPAISTAALD